MFKKRNLPPWLGRFLCVSWPLVGARPKTIGDNVNPDLKFAGVSEPRLRRQAILRSTYRFLVVFLVVFLDDFFADFFAAMALSPPFLCANLRLDKNRVNVFLFARIIFLDTHSRAALGA